jgi:hypothetical protein
MQEALLWSEFMAKVEAAYRKDGDHRFLIAALKDEFMPRSIRRHIVEMLFQTRVLMTPEWDAFEQVVTFSTPPQLLHFMRCSLQELPRPHRKFLDSQRTQQLHRLLIEISAVH